MKNAASLSNGRMRKNELKSGSFRTLIGLSKLKQGIIEEFSVIVGSTVP